jgi:hypothetical protein
VDIYKLFVAVRFLILRRLKPSKCLRRCLPQRRPQYKKDTTSCSLRLAAVLEGHVGLHFRPGVCNSCLAGPSDWPAAAAVTAAVAAAATMQELKLANTQAETLETLLIQRTKERDDLQVQVGIPLWCG